MQQIFGRATLLAILIAGLAILTTCSYLPGASSSALTVRDVTANPVQYANQEITVDGAYIWRPGNPGLSVLALGVSTLDNGLDAQPLGEPIWLEGFPAEVTADLHRPGDGVYGFVRVSGILQTGGGFGPEGNYQSLLQINRAEVLEQVQRVEYTLDGVEIPSGQISWQELASNPERYNGQRITTRGYYFWNSVIYVLSDGVSTEENGATPQPLSNTIWMEGFPPDQSAALTVGPNNSFVWGLVEVTGTFQTGGGFGKDGAYQSLFLVESAIPLEQP